MTDRDGAASVTWLRSKDGAGVDLFDDLVCAEILPRAIALLLDSPLPDLEPSHMAMLISNVRTDNSVDDHRERPPCWPRGSNRRRRHSQAFSMDWLTPVRTVLINRYRCRPISISSITGGGCPLIEVSEKGLDRHRPFLEWLCLRCGTWQAWWLRRIKRGCGQDEYSHTLGSAWAEWGHRALLVDLDPRLA